MKRIVICMLVGVLFAGSVLVVGKVQDMNTENQYKDNEETQEEGTICNVTQVPSEENVRQEDQENDSVFETDAEEKVAIETDTQIELKKEQVTKSDEIESAAQAKAKAEASAQMKAEEAKMSDKTLTHETPQLENAIVEVNRRYIEDCGSDSGYWEITYSDGHIEYIDE